MHVPHFIPDEVVKAVREEVLPHPDSVELVNRSAFGELTTAVADTVQRSNFRGVPPQEAYARALRAGDDRRARDEEILGRLTVPTQVLRWDEAVKVPDHAGFRRRPR
ncbi:hypothetical protein [Streptomyces sp. NPDC014733]|uniref:hypothetical protein n=1 Tax=Streptomyces sp. NPDC014733 TaxID=3364885 RepID=UPI0036FDCB6D